MATPNRHPDAEFISKRQEGFANAFQSGSVEDIMNYMCDSVDFSDYGTGEFHLNKEQTRDFFAHALGASEDVAIKTLSVSGDRHFSTWEWALRFRSISKAKTEGDSSSPETKSAEVKLLGISATWWDQEGKLMVCNHDYAVPVKEFEWEKAEEDVGI